MTLIIAASASTSVLALLVNSAVRALALSGVAALALAAFRVKTTAVRLFTWTAVLYAALAMPLLQWILPTVPIPTPAILQFGAAQPHDSPEPGATSKVLPTRTATGRPLSAAGKLSDASSSRLTRQALPHNEGALIVANPESSPAMSSSALWSSVRWSTVAAGIYFGVALLLLVRFFVGLVFGHRLMRASLAIDEPRVSQRLASRAYASGLPSAPRAAESEFISVPLTMGVLRSTILLPAGWREWDDAKLDAVVAHEVSHVARRDALTQRLSLLHRAVFWFSPLAWWLDRHLADLAEQASDEAALSSGADRKDYARTLLGFFEALQATRGRIWWQAVSMAKAGQAEQRVERILSWKGSVAMRLQKSVALVVIACASPVVYLAASAQAVLGVSLRNVQSAQEPPSSPPPAANGSRATVPPPLGPAESGPAEPGPDESGPASGVPAGTVV